MYVSLIKVIKKYTPYTSDLALEMGEFLEYWVLER